MSEPALGRYSALFDDPSKPNLAVADTPDLGRYASLLEGPAPETEKAVKESIIPGASISAAPTVLGELGKGNIGAAAELVYEAGRRQVSGLMGPTEKERSERMVPFGTNPDGSVKYEYKPLGNRLEQEGGVFTPFLEQTGPLVPPGSPTGFGRGPLANAIANTAQGVVGAIASPAGLAMLPATAARELPRAARTASGLFSVDMAHAAKEGIERALAAESPEEQLQAWTDAAASFFMAGAAGKHAVPRRTSFKTEKGSEYLYSEGETLSREKPDAEWHGPDKALKETPARTVFLEPDNAAGVSEFMGAPVEGGGLSKSTVVGPEGLRLTVSDRNGAVIESETVPFVSSPREGLHPFEVWGDGTEHVGNKIVEVSAKPEAPTPQSEITVQGQASSMVKPRVFEYGTNPDSVRVLWKEPNGDWRVSLTTKSDLDAAIAPVGHRDYKTLVEAETFARGEYVVDGKLVQDFREASPVPEVAQAPVESVSPPTGEPVGITGALAEIQRRNAPEALPVSEQGKGPVASVSAPEAKPAVSTTATSEPFGFGPGAAATGEFLPQREVSLQNARVDKERAARGELPLMDQASKAMEKTWDEGMAAVNKDPSIGERMVDDIMSSKKKDVSETDHAILLHEKIRVMNERDMMAERAADPYASEIERGAAHEQWMTLEERVNEIDLATKTAGTISGRALQFRQALARDDYTLAAMERRARVATGGPLKPEQAARVKALHDKVTKARKTADEARLAAQKERLERAIARKKGLEGAPQKLSKLEADLEIEILRTELNRLRALEKEAAQLGKRTPEEAYNLKRQLSIQERLKEMERLRAEGKFKPDKKPVPEKTRGTLRAEGRLLGAENEFKAWVFEQQLKAKPWYKKAGNLLREARGVILGSDIGVLTRQGLFAWSRPITAIKATSRAIRSAFSPEAMDRWAVETRDRLVNGKPALPERTKAGLQTTDTLSHPEELVITRLLSRLPDVSVGGRTVKLSAIGRTLERFQTTFINAVRVDLFDSALRKGLTPDELKLRANYINSSTGRGNAKHVPRILSTIMTSPRYEMSRWEMIGQPFRNLGVLAKDGAKGNLNRAALANIKDMAITAAEVYALFKLAELSGYSVTWNPTSSDFLKMRKGKDVWDVSAGLAPRLRDLIRMYVAFTHPTHQQTLGKTITAALLRTINPAIKTGIEQSSVAGQKAAGVQNPKLPFTGFKSEEEKTGLITLAPLIIQSMNQTMSEGPEQVFWTGAREFVGSSVHRYTDPEKKKQAQIQR